VLDRFVLRRCAPAVGEPLVEGVLKLRFAAVVGPALLTEPVEEVGFVLLAENDLAQWFAVDGCRVVAGVELAIAVDEPAGVTRRVDEPIEPDDAFSGRRFHLVDRFDIAVVGEHGRFVEPPAAQRDIDLSHTPDTTVVPKSRASLERVAFAHARQRSTMQTVEAAGLSIGDGHPARIMGVLNVSDQSPYEPSVFADPADAAAYVDALIDEGAEIIDVGLESANKRFEVLSAAEERERLDTAIETIDRVTGEAVFSIETRYHEVAAAALDASFDMVNDVCGFADPELPRVCEAHDAAVVKMASPPDLERPGALVDVDDIYDALAEGLTDKTIIDPAFGGWSEDKTLADDRETFRRLAAFGAIDRPMLVSINRKNFLGEIVGRETDDRLPASLAATALAVERGADVIRTHDVAETRDAARIGDALGDRAALR
jgi:dihydropteroate synthase